MQDFSVSPLRPPLPPPSAAKPALPKTPKATEAPQTVPLPQEALQTLTGKNGSAQAVIPLAESLLPTETVNRPLSIATPAQVQAAVAEALKASFSQVPPRAGESRHDLNRRLHNRPENQYKGANVVIIAFEGTGAFHPRCAPVMIQANERLRAQGLTPGSYELHSQVSAQMQQKEGKAMNWSGLAVGPLGGLLNDPQMAESTQWLSFPSEEFEALAGGDHLENFSLTESVKEAVLSSAGQTPGINQALLKLREIQAQAQAQGKDPQFVIVSHSSGGRSAVKFLEKAKALKDESGKPLHFPLVMTIDPVREAHEAVLEAGKELFYKGTEHNVNRLRGWVDALPLIEVKQKKVYPPLVRHQAQPESLYKPSNTGTFVSFFQRQDTEGLKMEPKFGIQGSPVHGAQNTEIHNVGSAGHGEIAYNPIVVQRFLTELKPLTEKK